MDVQCLNAQRKMGGLKNIRILVDGRLGLASHRTAIGHLHDDVILLLQPESFRFCFLVQIRAFAIKTSLGPDFQI